MVLPAEGLPHPLPNPCLLHIACPPAGAKQAAEILGPDALELAALYDQLCIIRFLHERMEEAAEAGAWGVGCAGRALQWQTLVRGAAVAGGRRWHAACRCAGWPAVGHALTCASLQVGAAWLRQRTRPVYMRRCCLAPLSTCSQASDGHPQGA